MATMGLNVPGAEAPGLHRTGRMEPPSFRPGVAIALMEPWAFRPGAAIALMEPWAFRPGVVIALAVSLLFAGSAYAQDAISALVGRPVTAIHFEIEGRSVSSAELESMVPIKTGDP